MKLNALFLPYLNKLESKSIYMIREAYQAYRDHLAILWSMGKDSTTLVHLVRKAFFGEVPIPVIHIDTSFKFKQIYEFRDRYTKRWNLSLIIARNDKSLRNNMSPEKGRFQCCTELKTEALKKVIEQYGFKALLVGIRRDEHAIRAKERYFSWRNSAFEWDYQNQPPELWMQYYQTQQEADAHCRIHPLLHWREIDVWRYIKKERLPVIPLYFAKGHQRYRSIGCACCCQPVASTANNLDRIIREIGQTTVAERSGRSQDKEKEYMMQKLRSLGYM